MCYGEFPVQFRQLTKLDILPLPEDTALSHFAVISVTRTRKSALNKTRRRARRTWRRGAGRVQQRLAARIAGTGRGRRGSLPIARPEPTDALGRTQESAVLSAGLLALATAPATLAQESDQALKQEIEALKQGQQQIRKDLLEIKKLLQAKPAAAAAPSGPNVRNKVFDIGSSPVKGLPTAKLTLIEFLDYQ